jgi:glyoxylase-like metal-dependent hydrolase (beta-lactamase superfamily II)
VVCQFDEVWIDEKALVLCMRHASRTARKRVLERMEKTGNALPEGFDSDSYILKGAGNLIKLKTGKIFNLGGLSGEVIGMKGHTAGSVGILLREEKVLLVGDAASPCAYMCLDESSAIADYIAMMEHTAALPFDVFFWGHEDTPLSKENHFLRFINVAKNICAERSTPFGGPYGIEGMLYQEDDVGIIFRKDKLKSKKSY